LQGVSKNLENKIEYLIGKEQDFYDFLDGINKKDKVAIVSHTDLDGITSAIFLQEILKSKGIKPKVLEFIHIGKGMFEETSKQLRKKKITKIFMSDLNESSDLESFEKLNNEFGVLLIDHHPSENKGSTNILKAKSEDCASWMIYNLGSKITNFDKWKTLICATMVAEFSYNDENNFNFLKENYPDLTKENIMNSEPGKLSNKIGSGLIFFRGKTRKIFDLVIKDKIKKLDKYNNFIQSEIQSLIEKFKKEAEFYPDKDLYFYYYTPKFNIGSVVITILSVQEPNKTFLFASDIENTPDFVKVSSRNQGGKVDLNLMMRKGIENLENANAGGHLKASAAQFLKKDLEKFKENILSYENP
jgi:single-stranded DNA-specific DHH superfamily exonuclease